MKKLLSMLVLFFIALPGIASAQVPDSCTLSWQAPTLNNDGSPLTDLEGFFIYHGSTAGGPYTTKIQVFAKSATIYIVDGLPPGNNYFIMTAYNGPRIESGPSNEALCVLAGTTPDPEPLRSMPPGGVSATPSN